MKGKKQRRDILLRISVVDCHSRYLLNSSTKLTARSDLNGIDSRQASPIWLEKRNAKLCQTMPCKLQCQWNQDSLFAATNLAICAQGSIAEDLLDDVDASPAIATVASAATAERRDNQAITSKKEEGKKGRPKQERTLQQKENTR